MLQAPLLGVIVWLAQLHEIPPENSLGHQQAGYIYQPAYCLDDVLREPGRPYFPQPGDIVLPTDHNLFWTVGHDLALAGQPHHSGIVIALPEGKLGMLEAGPHDTIHCEILDLAWNIQAYEKEGPVWVRRRTVPLTAEQSANLTSFALAQDGKRFALARLAGQLTPFRSRGPVRTRFVGGPHGDRRAYFCSELVTEACVAAGLLDPATTRPAATFPHDLFFDRSLNPYISKNMKLAPDWDPPARWSNTLPEK
jgi:hypothetical protein